MIAVKAGPRRAPFGVLVAVPYSSERWAVAVRSILRHPEAGPATADVQIIRQTAADALMQATGWPEAKGLGDRELASAWSAALWTQDEARRQAQRLCWLLGRAPENPRVLELVHAAGQWVEIYQRAQEAVARLSALRWMQDGERAAHRAEGAERIDR